MVTGRRQALALLAAAAAAGAVVYFVFLRQEPAGGEPAEAPPEVAKKDPPVAQRHPRPIAVARIAGVGGSAAQGSVRFVAREKGGVSIDYRLENVSPGKHVLAVHDTADCSAASAAEPVGEVGQVVANVMGRTRGRLGHERMSLGEGPVDVLGRALAIHEGDSAGGIVGCGVLESL